MRAAIADIALSHREEGVDATDETQGTRPERAVPGPRGPSTNKSTARGRNGGNEKRVLTWNVENVIATNATTTELSVCEGIEESVFDVLGSSGVGRREGARMRGGVDA